MKKLLNIVLRLIGLIVGLTLLNYFGGELHYVIEDKQDSIWYLGRFVRPIFIIIIGSILILGSILPENSQKRFSEFLGRKLDLD
tara:strand:+ start:93 stop:344 length:252 start_codon:yes stop_codon:yes gene_type:complete